MKSLFFSRNVYLIQVIQISICMKCWFPELYTRFQKFLKWIPVSRDQNINFEEVRWFPEMYTCFRLEKYQLWWSLFFPEMYTWFKLCKYQCWWSALISRNVYKFQVLKISIFVKYVDIQKCIPVSGYKNI